MTIKEKFGQAVMGSGGGDPAEALIHIHRPEINLVTSYIPLSAGAQIYLRGLDIENRYLKAGTYTGYGHEPAFFEWDKEQGLKAITNELPDIEGYNDFMGDIEGRASLFSRVSGYETVQVMLRALSATKNNLVVHVDNQTGLRGLQTLTGDVNTLWLPDQDVKLQNFDVQYDEQGRMVGNHLRTTFDDLARLQQIEKHHMSIHKGSNYDNPLFHSAPGYNPDLKMFPGTRMIATFDNANR